MMKRTIAGALVLVALLSLAVGNAVASDLDALRVSLTPEGPAQTDFPSGTETVYVVFEYSDFVLEKVRLVVSDYSGETVFQKTQTFVGSGIGSIPVTVGQGPFPDGPYVATLYYAGQYLTQAVEWTVGGVDSPPVPTAFPPARLEVQPTILTFSAEQGGSNPSSQRVLISNSTAAASVWQATADSPWLRLTPAGGETPALLKVSVDSSGLPAGTYAGRVTVSADEIDGSPQTVDVSLAISPPEGTTTLDLPALADGTGWVVSDEAAGNHFGEGEIQAGSQAGREYLGGLQFDLSGIPDEADIRAAALILPGLRWEVKPSAGDWIVELIDGGLAEEWAGYGYSEIAGLPPATALVPALGVSNLAAGRESVWYLDTTGLDILESSAREGDVSAMRVRYRPSLALLSGPAADAEDGLFVWDAAGVLRVNFDRVAAPDRTATPPVASATPTVTLPAQTPTVVPPTATPTPVVPPPPPGKWQPVRASSMNLVLGVAVFGVLGVITWRIVSVE